MPEWLFLRREDSVGSLSRLRSNGPRGDVALKSRDASDYQVSILEVAGTAATMDDMLKMGVRWKSKLQSREMGLNRN